MNFPSLTPGFFVRRDNRFRATVRVDGAAVAAHVANSGRLADLFVPDRPVWLAHATTPGRKTAYDLKLVELDGVLVSVDARLPNPLAVLVTSNAIRLLWHWASTNRPPMKRRDCRP